MSEKPKLSLPKQLLYILLILLGSFGALWIITNIYAATAN
jgi:hypothetical protein